jgi:hypothetical protein
MLELFLMMAALAQPPPHIEPQAQPVQIELHHAPKQITAPAARTETRIVDPPPRRLRGNKPTVPNNKQHRKRHENRTEKAGVWTPGVEITK